MASSHSEYDDADFDDSLFPAYANYIRGVDSPWYEKIEEHLGLNSLPFPNAGPIPYTNSMPSRQVTDAPAKAGIKGGPSVLDLRSSSRYQELGSLIPPEPLHFAPPTPMNQMPAHMTPGSDKHLQAISSAELTRRKLLQASQQRLETTTSPMLITPEKRRMPARQATHPSLLRSSSATDIGSQAGDVPPSGRPVQMFAASPTPVRPQAYSNFQTPQQSDQSSPAPLIKPGDLLTDSRYKDATESHLKRMDSQITELYYNAQNGLDPESRKRAVVDIAALSARVHRMAHDWEQQKRHRQLEEEAQKQAHAQAQYSQRHSAQPPSHYGQSQDFTDDFEQAMPSPQYEAHVLPQQHIQPMPHHAPVQQVPHYAQPGPEYLLPVPPLAVSAKLRDDINGQIPKYVHSCRLLAASRADPGDTAGCDAAQIWQQDFRAKLPPAGLHYLDDVVGKILSRQNVANPQPHHPIPAPQPHLAQQTNPAPLQATALTEPLRQHIHTHLPQYIAAMQLSRQPTTAGNAASQQQAQNFRLRFRAGLPPEGLAYMEEVVRRMVIEKNQGRDPMALLQI